MGIKNFLKKSKIYNFFNYNFSSTKEQVKENSNKIDSIDNTLMSLKQTLENLENKTDVIYNTINSRTSQFDYINTELLLLKSESKPKILIAGFYGAPNTGDELMLQSLLSKIDSTKYSITVMLADNPNYKLENYKNINFIHYPKTNMDINIISNYFDKIIFGGGALLEDEYYNEFNSYKYNTAKILIDLCTAGILNNKKIYCIGLSAATQLTNTEYILKLDFIIQNSEHFSLRDTNSLKTLERAGIKSIDKIEIIPDLIFSMPQEPYNMELKNSLDEFTIGLILIAHAEFNKLQNIILWTDELSKKINKKMKLKLIPFYDFCNSDTVNLTKLIENINIANNIEIVPYTYEYTKLNTIFDDCNLIINMRYHSSLLSLKKGIPSIHLIYDIHSHYCNKMNYLKEKYTLNKLFLSFSNLNKKDFENAFIYALDNLSQINIIENEISKKIIDDAKIEHLNIIKKF